MVSCPTSGTTWLRFLAAHTITGAEADFDSIRTVFAPLELDEGCGLALASACYPLGRGT